MAKKSLIFMILAVILLNLSSVYAVKIHGTIYNMDLNIARNTVLKINTVPEQTYVSKDGLYSFTVPNGDYIITAAYQLNYKKYNVEQKITVKEEGDYVLDLILFPDISEEEDILNEEINLGDPYEEGVSILWYLGILAVILVTALTLYLIKLKPKKKPEIKIENDLTEEVVKFIKEQGGRVTQKDIRKKFPMSEAKISLVITELEHKGIIEKIKKGRGNIIILKS